MKKKISVIIPCYNSEKTIIRTLESIKKQTYTDFEVLIINDGSSDCTSNLIADFATKDNRFIIFNIPKIQRHTNNWVTL